MSVSNASPAARSRDIYRERIDRVIDLVAEHYAQPLPLAKAARVAGFSSFHFHRIFKALVGEPLHAYLVRVRLERAVHRMAHGPRGSLTDLALECGFASSSDFSRAFKAAYGLAPSRYSRAAFLEKSKIRQDLLVNADYGLPKVVATGNPDRFRVRLVDRPTQRIAYVRVIGAYRPEPILRAYATLMDWGRRQGIVPGAELLGRSPDDPDITPMAKVRFDWCLAVPPEIAVSGPVSAGRIAARRCACIHVQGDIQSEFRAWTYLFREWLPRSGP